MLRKLLWMLKEPKDFFEGVREEGYRESFIFLLQVSAVIAFFTPIVNYLGWESTDRTSTYQAQIWVGRSPVNSCCRAWVHGPTLSKPSSSWVWP